EDDNGLTAAGGIVIDQYRHAMIGVHLEEFSRELIATPDITGHDLIRYSQFLQQDCHLLAIRCRPIVDVVHRSAFLSLPGSKSNGWPSTMPQAPELESPPCPRGSDCKKCLSGGTNRDSVTMQLNLQQRVAQPWQQRRPPRQPRSRQSPPRRQRRPS